MKPISLHPSTRAIAAARFWAVGASGLVVNSAVLVLAVEAIDLGYVAGAIVATQASSIWTFLGTEHWAFRARRGRTKSRSYLGRAATFVLLNNAALVFRVPLLWVLVSAAGLLYLVANLVTLAITFALRFALADGWVWRATSAVEPIVPPPVGGSYPAVRVDAVGPESVFSYDIAGLIAIHSEVELPELAYFVTARELEHPDIRIEIAPIGGLPRRTGSLEHAGTRLSYLEQLGAASANFRVTMGKPIRVEVSPLLAKSRHVLYTNVLEALLRFLLVSRGFVLLHSAAVTVGGQAALLSARTDTGKTSTVIRLVRERGYQFLSDDMTIVSPDGRALCYPKPMTLSYHTLSVISGRELRRRQRAALAVQSRLHSKSGRSVGRALGRLNIPIMSVNSVVQILVPPPKYRIDALLECEIGREAPIGHVVLMERGSAERTEIGVDEAVDRLIENTDDAYGFPPFESFAPLIEIDGVGYTTLRTMERDLLRSALHGARLWRLSVPGHEWGDVLPEIFAEPPRDRDAGYGGTPVLVGEHRRLTPVQMAVVDAEAKAHAWRDRN